MICAKVYVTSRSFELTLCCAKCLLRIIKAVKTKTASTVVVLNDKVRQQSQIYYIWFNSTKKCLKIDFGQLMNHNNCVLKQAILEDWRVKAIMLATNLLHWRLCKLR